ncbi:MAG TPA: response regulator, partial [Thermomicrobiales bacterium]|nr:response regulator [Thermomicrobiales bacterium]
YLEHGLEIDRDAIEMIVVCWKMLPAMLRKLDDLSLFASPVSSVVRRSDELTERLKQQVAKPTTLPVAEPADAEPDTSVEDVAPFEPEAVVAEPVVVEILPTDVPEHSSWPAAERLRESTRLDGNSVTSNSEPQPEPATEQPGLSRERLGSALLDLAFSSELMLPDATADGGEEQGEVYDEDQEAAFADEMRRLFAEECVDLLGVLTRAAMQLERDPDALGPLRDAVQALHTLKGGAFAAGVAAVADECHQLEAVLGGDDRTGAVEAMFNTIDRIETLMQSVLTRADRPLADAATTSDEARLRVPVARLDDMLNLVGELVVNRAGLEQRLERMSASLGELLLTAERLLRSGASLERQPLSDMSRNGAAIAAGSSEWDDLEFDRYTEFDRLVRELTEIGADVSASVNELSGLRGDLDTVSARQRRLTGALQDQLMDIRMVPLASIAPRFYRVIRQVAATRGKQVRLVLEGGETTFDSTLLEALSESMLHLLRNAVDHGIESPSERRRAGKLEEGTIRVRAYRDGGEAVIEVLDDGAGIDEQRVIQKARERGITLEDDASRADALRLIFQPAFTTRDQADEVSGRGVGLEIVESAVSHFKGRVSIDSSPGAGTAISLRLPVMLSVTQAFMVQAAGATYAVPIGNIDLVADRRETPLSRVGNGLVLETGDGAIPVVDLAQRLGSSRDEIATDDGWIMVASVANERWALCVDELAGQQEIMVKPLGRFVRNSPGVVGATILGNGDVALIVDVVRLLQPDTAVRFERVSGMHSHGEDPQDADSRPVALIVDDSLSVRRVVGRTLERNGWQALLARDGQEALDMLEAGRIDVMITDIEMPRMDGYELMSAVNAHATLSPVPVIVLTSRSGQKHRERAVDLGASAYVVKPFQEQQLLEAVETVTSARRQAGRS